MITLIYIIIAILVYIGMTIYQGYEVKYDIFYDKGHTVLLSFLTAVTWPLIVLFVSFILITYPFLKLIVNLTEKLAGIGRRLKK